MTKAKIMLTSIVVLSIVGGALAFKAKTNAGVYCLSPNPIPQQPELCNSTNFTTDPAADGQTSTDPCPDKTYFFKDNACAGNTFIEATNTVTATDE